MTILLRLLFAHILCDFFFQSDKICNEKQGKTKKKYVYQLLHSFIHAITAYLFVADWNNWILPLVIFVSHTLMDYIKVEYLKKNESSFIKDQIIHIFVIIVLWLSLYEHSTNLCQVFFKAEWNSLNFWLLFIAYSLILKPTSVLLSLFIRRWTPSQTQESSLPNAGKWIGYFERILILTFILTGTAEGIGFLLAAKSIFRFGELSKAQEIRTTEYVMIGTFASFTTAILIGVLVSLIISRSSKLLYTLI